MDISTEIAAIEAASEGEELRQPLIDVLDALNSDSLPAVTSSDAGKILKVSSSGEWVVGEKSGYMPVPSETKQINSNGTYDVTNYASAAVNVSGGDGSTVFYQTTDPSSGAGVNGDVWIKYVQKNPFIEVDLSVTGGYNGGAVINIQFDGTTVFTATGDSPYNMDYTNKSAIVHGVSIVVTPPATSTSDLVITFTSSVETITKSIHYSGSNTSYGYSYSNTFDFVIFSEAYCVIDSQYIKQNEAWKGLNDVITIPV